MARSLEQQAVFFELDGVVLQQPRLTSEGNVTYYDGALSALARINPVHVVQAAVLPQVTAFGEKAWDVTGGAMLENSRPSREKIGIDVEIQVGMEMP